MTNQEKINIIKHSLEHIAFKDIIRSSKRFYSSTSFILCSCLIDALAGFRYGWTRIDEKERKRSNSKLFQDFIKEYMNSYDPDKLYKDMRCRLVHNFSIGDNYLFISQDPTWHKEIRNGRTHINLDNFILDIKLAMEKYFSELESDVKIQELALKRYDSLGIIVKMKLDKSNKLQLDKRIYKR